MNDVSAAIASLASEVAAVRRDFDSNKVQVWKRLDEDARLFSDIRVALMQLNTTITTMTTQQQMQHTDIQRLLTDMNQRVGRDGFINALLRTPVFMWLSGLFTSLAAVWVWLKSGAGGTP